MGLFLDKAHACWRAFTRTGRAFRSHWWTLILECVPAGMVMACLVALSSPMWEPVDTLLLRVMTRSAVGTHSHPSDGSTRPQDKRPIHILKISEEDFSKIFNNTSPLNRCQLVDFYLNPLLANKNRTLAIDLDLSPVSNKDDSSGCQEKMDALIREHRDRLILMEPTELNAKGDRDVIHKWRQQFGGATASSTEGDLPLFGSVEIPLHGGVAKKFERNLGACNERSEIPPHFADLIAAYRLANTPSPVNPEVQGPSLLQTWHLQTCFATSDHHVEEQEAETHIPFHALLTLPNRSMAVPREKLISDTQSTELVILGSGYTPDDQYTNPLPMKLDGVDIHALVAFTHPRAESPLDHLFHWFLDVLLAAFFLGPLFNVYWKKYFQKAQRPEEGACLPLFLWLGGIGLIFLTMGLMILFVFVNETLTNIQNFLYRIFYSIPVGVDLGIMPIFIPAAIMVGMLIDSLVVSSIESATGLFTELTGKSHAKSVAVSGSHSYRIKKADIALKWMPFFLLLLINFYFSHLGCIEIILLSVSATIVALICSRAGHKKYHANNLGEVHENPCS